MRRWTTATAGVQRQSNLYFNFMLIFYYSFPDVVF